MTAGGERGACRVLVADDHSLTRNLVKAILRGADLTEVVTVDDGEAAVRAVRDGTFDLVVCDWNMPKATGLEVLRRVREDPRTEALPFLMLTAEAYRENVLAAVSAGATDYVVKPFTAEILLGKVERILGREGPKA